MRWKRNEVIYQILVDRFSPVDEKKAKKPIFAGGTLQGIIEHLSYFKDLGVSALWLSPIYEGTAYHGYHITNFMQIDPHFGTLDDFKELINTFHDNDIKIMLDFVPNHVSAKHPFFIEAQHKKNKGFVEWFYLGNKETYETFMGFEELPKLNLDFEPAGQYVIHAAKYWLSLGVDGLRLDHVIGPSLEFWRRFNNQVKRMFPNSFLLGEVWAEQLSWKDLKTTRAKNKMIKYLAKAKSDTYMKDYQGILDGCIDFTFNAYLREYIFEHKHKNTFAKDLSKHYKSFDKNFMLATFLDNHDMDRFYFDCNHKEDYKKAIDLAFAQDQPTIIYYGNESGMSQDKHMKEFFAHGDLQVRQPMNFDTMDAELVEYYKTHIKTKTRN